MGKAFAIFSALELLYVRPVLSHLYGSSTSSRPNLKLPLCTRQPGHTLALPPDLDHPGDGARDHPSGQRARDGWRGAVRWADRQTPGHGLLRGAVPDVRRARRCRVGAPVPTAVLRRLRRVQGAELFGCYIAPVFFGGEEGCTSY